MYSLRNLPARRKIDLIPIYEFIFEMIKNEELDWEYRNINVMNLRKYELPGKDDDYPEDPYEFDEDEDDDEAVKVLALKSLEEEALQYRLMKIREQSAHEYDYDKDDSFYSDHPQEFEYDIRGNRLPVGFLRDDLIVLDQDSYAHLSSSPEIAETLDEEIQRLSKRKVKVRTKSQLYDGSM
ncbi:hypothetical protein [Pedobacter frigoris]|uniref:Uncharacterized protein n=1 Tax=Pedobacter frigoris TaxID=2571272 RepID=A0A4V6WN59_9SPHI|nr:hypothetical protein [Pedobacter frigoris]TKC08542.1 hypothetical protein FA047_00115 [Pedobacter frigoris]